MFRTIVFAAGFLLFQFVTVEASEERFIPLSKIIERDNSRSTVLYTFERCASLYIAVHKYTGNDKATPKLTLDKLEELYAEFATRATFMIREIRGIENPAAIEVIKDLIVSISNNYVGEMDAHYARTGEAFNELVISDLQICTGLAKEFQKKN